MMFLKKKILFLNTRITYFAFYKNRLTEFILFTQGKIVLKMSTVKTVYDQN